MPRYAQARSKDYPIAINALLIKRVELLRIGQGTTQIEAVAALFGYTGPFDEYVVPKNPHNRVFGRALLSRQIITVMLKADRPLTAREIADRFPQHQQAANLAGKVSRSLDKMRTKGRVVSERTVRGILWKRAT